MRGLGAGRKPPASPPAVGGRARATHRWAGARALLIVCRRIGDTLAPWRRVTRTTLAQVALGEAVRELRHAAGISQEELAFLCGMHRTYVGGIERGERNPSFRALLRLAEALGVQASDLLGRYEDRRRATGPRGGRGR
ncbi:MAG: helix-turn-helix transcriptional regulator [Actinobacteria bacterium]|nr:MAG: helix-turn-helix transcriptional regulator [Actinomycetota bacterium]